MASARLGSPDKVHFREESDMDLDEYIRRKQLILDEAEEDAEVPASQAGDSGIEGSEVDAMSEQEEAPSPLPLIEGFPRFENRPKRARSCQLTKASSRCVAKATQHLELLQNVIEDWYEKKAEEEAAGSRVASQPTTAPPASRATPASRARRVPQLTPEVLRGAVRSTSGRTPELEVIGFGEKTPSLRPQSSKASSQLSAPTLGAAEVLEEAVALLGRLETERQDAELSFLQERQRVKSLRAKIDELAMQRMIELPRAVQREHEACSRDINELQWHLAYRERGHEKLKAKAETAQTLNEKLKQDIEFVRKHVPLMKEKLDLEEEAMQKINKAQNSTVTELNQTMTRCGDAQHKSEEAYAKATDERTVIKRDLETVNNELTAINEELAEAKRTFNTQTHRMHEIRDTLRSHQQQLQMLELKNENAKAASAAQAQKVEELKKRIKEEEKEKRRLETELYEQQKDLDEKVATYKEENRELDRSIDKLQSRSRQLTKTIETKELDIEDLTAKLNDCQRQRVLDEKNVVRLKKEMIRVDEQMEMTTEEHVKVSLINQTVHDRLRDETEKCTVAEEGLKSTAEQLRRQVRDEIHNRAMIQARMETEGDDFVKEKSILETRHKKMEGAFREMTFEVKEVEEKVKTLRQDKEEREEKMATLQKNLTFLVTERARIDEEAETKLTVLRPEHGQLTEELGQLDSRIAHIKRQSETMRSKMQEYKDQAGMMDRSAKKINSALVVLREEVQELELQIDAQKSAEKTVTSQLDAVNHRLQESGRQHREHMSLRGDVLRQINRDLEESLTQNTELAARYRKLQQEFLWRKSLLMNELEQRVGLEGKAKDAHQVLGLQQRMRAALLEYFKLRGEYNTQELQQMEAASSNNAHKVKTLQVDMDRALGTIANFLQSQVEGEVARKSAMSKVRREETTLRKLAASRQNTRASLLAK